MREIKPFLMAVLATELKAMAKTPRDLDDRALVLSLRHRMRMEMHLRPLTEHELSGWHWEDPVPMRQYRYVGPQRMNDQPRLTPAQIEAAASFRIPCTAAASRPIPAIPSRGDRG